MQTPVETGNAGAQRPQLEPQASDGSGQGAATAWARLQAQREQRAKQRPADDPLQRHRDDK